MSSVPPGSRAGRRGFTLIELLTVIAIIAVLAALLFPVLAAVRKNAQKTSCMSNLHSLLQGLEMYRDDWRVYPEVLYGFDRAQGSGACTTPATGTDFPELRLYPSYVKDQKVFTCPSAPFKPLAPVALAAINPMTGNPNAPAAPPNAPPVLLLVLGQLRLPVPPDAGCRQSGRRQDRAALHPALVLGQSRGPAPVDLAGAAGLDRRYLVSLPRRHGREWGAGAGRGWRWWPSGTGACRRSPRSASSTGPTAPSLAELPEALTRSIRRSGDR